jgi:hypothetical protein
MNTEQPILGLEKETGFFEDNQNLIITIGTGILSFVGGIATGVAYERNRIQTEIQKIATEMEVAYARIKNGDEAVEIDGVKYQTKDYAIESFAGFEEAIMGKLIDDKKLNKKDKKVLRELMNKNRRLTEELMINDKIIMHENAKENS